MASAVGVFGATGYTGRELAALLSAHPRVQLRFTTGSARGHLSHEEGLEQPADAYLLCLPHGVSGRYAERLRRERPEAVVIDLSGDLRLPTPESYRAWYGHEHPAPELLGRAAYGLTEVCRDALREARLVANPGCYATSVLLPLVPLLREGLVDADDIVVDAKSGASGAGRTPSEDLLFCEVDEDLKAYSPGRTHRHVGEIEALLASRAGRAVELAFCPHLLPVKRGILAAVYVRTTQAPERLREELRRFYDGSPFVRVVEGGPPRLSDVVRTNQCLLSVHPASPSRAVVFSALDNLMKGAAGQAVQNLNLAMGWPETSGLPVAGAG